MLGSVGQAPCSDGSRIDAELPARIDVFSYRTMQSLHEQFEILFVHHRRS
jgi:hypothetical protein